MWNPFNPKNQKSFRRKLRNDMPQPERVLWGYLRGQQLGVKFRRQCGIGPYVADFYCPECSLAVELDGDSHFSPEQEEKDAKRNAYFASLGIMTLRFTNGDAMESIDGVMGKIIETIEELKIEASSNTPSSSP